MPKRDDAYMEAQKAAISRATLECIIENGVFATTQRDICRKAGVSTGAFYTHFPSMEDAVVAATMLNADLSHVNRRPKKITSWDEYCLLFNDILELLTNERLRKRWRMILQFASKIVTSEWSPESLAELNDFTFTRFESALKNLHEAGILTLPMGLRNTAHTHVELLQGATFGLGFDKTSDPQAVYDRLMVTLALTAGRTA